MANLSDFQKKIAPLRTAYQKSVTDFYKALQSWSLGNRGSNTPKPVPAALNVLAQTRTGNKQKLQNAIAEFSENLSPQDSIGQISANIPFVLLPLRIEARYVVIKHVVRDLPTKDVVDISDIPFLVGRLRNTGFLTNSKGEMCYSLPSVHRVFHNNFSTGRINPESLIPPGNQYMRRVDDIPELRLRFYPDDVSIENRDTALQQGEWQAGVQFWKNVCSGKPAQEEWLQLAITGSAPRAAWIVQCTKPINVTDLTKLPAQPQFPAAPEIKDGSYTTAPLACSLPERLVVRLYKNETVREFTGNLIPEELLTGIDPGSDPFNQTASSSMQQDGKTIQTPDYLKWIHDFDEAEKNGMAIRVNLGQFPEFNGGVDKIIVTGIRFSDDEKTSTTVLEALLQNHKYQESGMKVLPKGTPTNSVAKDSSEIKRKEDEALLYFTADFARKPANPLNDESRIKQVLGLNKLFSFPNGHLTEINEASLINRLLWPATWGYYLTQFFSPAIDETSMQSMRSFFTGFVSGRGTLPVLKINQQPYGLIPVSSMNHWEYGAAPDELVSQQMWTGFLQPLLAIWRSASGATLNLNSFQETGIDDSFLQMIGTNAISGRMQRSWVGGQQFQSVLQKSRPESTTGPLIEDPLFQPALVERTLLAFGDAFAGSQQITRTYQTAADSQVDHPAGKHAGVAGETAQKIPGLNITYLEWLATAPIADIWANNLGSAVTNPPGYTPTLFEQCCRQALLRTALDSAIRVTENNPGIRLLKTKDFEALTLHSGRIEFDASSISPANLFLQHLAPIVQKFNLSGPVTLEADRRVYLQQSHPATGGLPAGDWLFKNKKSTAVPAWKEFNESLQYFSKAPVATLEKLFGEHLDLCSHRLDAWITGLVQQRLITNRKKKPAGIYLGSFGYLLQLKPSQQPAIIIQNKKPEYMPATRENISVAAIPLFHGGQAKSFGITVNDPGWNKTFFYLGENPEDQVFLNVKTGKIEPASGINVNESDGFIHAPSLALAATSAIMRSGYNNHLNDDKSSLLSVQLNSERVRQALGLLEGMQQGIPLGTLTGYYFERLLHENDSNHMLLDLRTAFPVHIQDETNSGSSPMTTIDGMTMLNKRNANPAGWLLPFPKLNPHKQQIEKLVVLLESYLDALNDLLLTESVFQTVNGNLSRIASPLRTMNNAGLAAYPECIRPSQKGKAIVQRVGIIFKQTAATSAWSAKGSPRSLFCPAINQWLSEMLPPPARIVVLSSYGGKIYKTSLAELAISPVDLLTICPESFVNNQSGPLDLLIQLTVIKANKLPLPTVVDDFKVLFKDRSKLTKAELSLFECASLISSLSKLVLNSRSISPADLSVPDQRSIFKTVKPEKLQAVLKSSITAGGIFKKQIIAIDTAIKTVQTAVKTNKTGAALETPIKNLLFAMYNAWQPHIQEIPKPALFANTPESIQELITNATTLKSTLELNFSKATQAQEEIKNLPTPELITDQLQKAAEFLFGSTIRIVPEILPENFKELQTALSKKQRIKNASATQVDDWISEATLVRKNLLSYRNAQTLAEILTPEFAGKTLNVIQLPFVDADQNWIGNSINEGMRGPGSPNVSLVLEAVPGFAPAKAFSGLLVDEWPEWIPDKTVDTGISFQFNQPATEAPQGILIAVAPKTQGNWQWDYLTGAVEDALELAKIRLVSPEKIGSMNAGLKHLLPAVMLPFAENNFQVPVAGKI